ncbi:MAG: PAS domain S-box protein, partial [Leptospiraceae bacterium]|nr:PAS domain S-box protein [Leptospiraceae bacterium]
MGAQGQNTPQEFNLERLQGLYHLSPLGIALNNLEGAFIEANQAFCRITGYSLMELRSMDYWQLTPPKFKAQEMHQLAELRSNGQYGPYTKEYIHKFGHTVFVRLVGVLVTLKTGEQYIWSIVEDISTSISQQSHIRLMDNVFQNVLEGICITDASEKIIEVNQFFCDLTGFTRKDIIGQTPRMLASGKHSPDFYREMWTAIKENDSWRGELWNRRPDGDLYAIRLTITVLRNQEGAVTHLIGVLMDITRQKEQAIHMERMAHYDALTGIPNRVLLADRMRQAIAQNRRHKKMLAICYLDLDGFKPV